MRPAAASCARCGGVLARASPRSPRALAEQPRIPESRLLAADALRVASVGLRTRRLRAALSALGVAIGIAAMVAVLGISDSSKAGLVAELNELGNEPPDGDARDRTSPAKRPRCRKRRWAPCAILQSGAARGRGEQPSQNGPCGAARSSKRRKRAA